MHNQNEAITMKITEVNLTKLRHEKERAARHGIIYNASNNTITHQATGMILNLDEHEWLAGYIPDWQTIEFIMYGMTKDLGEKRDGIQCRPQPWPRHR